MKKTNLWMLALLTAMLGLASCADSDNPVINPDDPTTPAVDPVTEEEYENDDLMDRTVNPGDSFYDFALGTWLQTHDSDDEGLMDNAGADMMGSCAIRFLYSQDPVASKLMEIAASTTKQAEAEAMTVICPKLTEAYINVLEAADDDVVVDINTRADVIEIVASLIKKGYSPLVRCTTDATEGQYKKVLTAGRINDDVREALKKGDEDAALQAVMAIAERMLDVEDEEEMDEEDLEIFASVLLDIDQKVFEATNDRFSEDLRVRAKAKPTRTLKPSQLRTRAAGADLYTLLNITDANGIVDEQVRAILDIIDTEDPDNLVVYLMYNLIGENIDLVDSAADGFDDDDWDDWDDDDEEDDDDDEDEDDDLRTVLYMKLMTQAPAILSRLDYDALSSTPKYDVEGCRTMMEQMRQLMDSRISTLDWMSDATKTAAREKLGAMKFNIGVPATKPGTDITLTFNDETGETIVSAMQQLRQQRFEALMKLADNGVKTSDNGWDIIIESMPLNTFNAFYAPNMNQLFILPAFIGEDMFPKDNEVMRYATAMVFGHEMSHGFDTEGTQYGADGTMTDWWTPADKAAFQQRADKMVALFSQLKQYGNVPADGEKTLDENIADLGGISLAFALYQQKLADDGLTADERNHQLREFFLHYALLWQEDPSPDDVMEQLLTDVHSIGRNRIDGITRLMDEWYTLFNVTGGKNYLAPADRVKIW